MIEDILAIESITESSKFALFELLPNYFDLNFNAVLTSVEQNSLP